jgi:MYXO-CTERM domain-containing protein
VTGAGTLTAVTGAHAPGTVDVVVSNPDGQSGKLTGGFIYTLAPAPTLVSVTPASGPSTGGTVVTLAGTHLAAGAAVSFGSVAAANVQVAATGLSLTASTGAHPAGLVDVTLVNPDGQMVTLTNGFDYAIVPAPTVSSIAPSSGTDAGGTMISITGDHFVAGATVALGGTAATGVNVVSPTSLVAFTAAHTAGQVDVVVTNPDAQAATLTGGFTYVAPQPPDLGPDLAGSDGSFRSDDLGLATDAGTVDLATPSSDLSAPWADLSTVGGGDGGMGAPMNNGGCSYDTTGGSPGFGLFAAALLAALLLRRKKIDRGPRA